MKNWDQILAFLLEKALKELPPGTRLVAKDYEIKAWLDTRRVESCIVLNKTDEPGGWDTVYSATLQNDPRSTKTRKFDLSEGT